MFTDRARPPGARVWWPDLAVGVVLATAMALASGHIPRTGNERGLDLLGFGLIVAAALALAFARRHPKAVLAVVTTALAAYILRRYVGGPIYVTGWLALAALSWRSDRRTAVIGGCAAWVALGTASLLASGDRWIGALIFVGWSAAAVPVPQDFAEQFPGLLLEAFASGGTSEVTASRAIATVAVYGVIAAIVAFTVFGRRDVTS